MNEMGKKTSILCACFIFHVKRFNDLEKWQQEKRRYLKGMNHMSHRLVLFMSKSVNFYIFILFLENEYKAEYNHF